MRKFIVGALQLLAGLFIGGALPIPTIWVVTVVITLVVKVVVPNCVGVQFIWPDLLTALLELMFLYFVARRNRLIALGGLISASVVSAYVLEFLESLPEMPPG